MPRDFFLSPRDVLTVFAVFDPKIKVPDNQGHGLGGAASSSKKKLFNAFLIIRTTLKLKFQTIKVTDSARPHRPQKKVT